MVDALRIAKKDLDDSILPYLEKVPPDSKTLGRLRELSGRNATSARILQQHLRDLGDGDVQEDLWLDELEVIAKYFENTEVSLAIRIRKVGQRRG